MSKYFRTTITVPVGLKARMDAVEEEVNWSAVAAQAFEQRLAQIIQQKGPTNVDDVVKRLRASKKRVANWQYQQGLKKGAEWARRQADVDELERLKREFGRGWDQPFLDSAGGDTVAFFVAFNIVGDDEAEGHEAMVREYGERIFGSEHPACEYVKGFVEGAVKVWQSVEERVLNEDEEQEETEEEVLPPLPLSLRGRLRSTMKSLAK
jgi:hypothetical protein